MSIALMRRAHVEKAQFVTPKQLLTVCLNATLHVTGSLRCAPQEPVRPAASPALKGNRQTESSSLSLFNGTVSTAEATASSNKKVDFFKVVDFILVERLRNPTRPPDVLPWG